MKKNKIALQASVWENRVEMKSLGAFTVIGIAGTAKASGENKIPALWDTLFARADEISGRINPNVAFGVERNFNREKVTSDYLAGFSVKENATTPPGMEKWYIPAQTYAVFPCTLSTLRKVYSFIYNEFLPHSPFARADGPEFEYYDENFAADNPDSTLYLYVPIKKK